MKFTAIAATLLVAAAEARDVTTRGAVAKRQNKRALQGKGDSGDDVDPNICGSCPYDVFYHYVDSGPPSNLHGVFKSPPSHCSLAAIRDDDARRGAQYAIPEGKIAITQGYIPIGTYTSDCIFSDEKTDDGMVTGCSSFYIDLFQNYEQTSVVNLSFCWVDFSFPIPDGAIHAGIGSDGLLRPIQQWNYNTAESAYAHDGAVYECCPSIANICNTLLPEPESEDE